MLDALYERSMRQEGDRRAVRVLLASLLALTAAGLGLLALPVDEVIQAEGSVVPLAVVEVQAPEAAWVMLPRDLTGERVAEGQVLGEWREALDTEQARRELRRDEIELEHLRREAELKAAQTEVGRDWQEDMRALSQRVAALQERVAAQWTRLAPRPLAAGQAGVVLRSAVAPGAPAWLARGSPVLTLFRPDALVVRVTVPAHQAGELAYAGRVILENERTHAQFPGRLVRTFYRPGADGARLDTVVDVEAAPGADLAPGLPLEVRIVTRTRPLLFLLRAALADQR